MNCDRCNQPIENEADKVKVIISSDAPKATGTDLTVCYECGKDATILIGNWLYGMTLIDGLLT